MQSGSQGCGNKIIRGQNYQYLEHLSFPISLGFFAEPSLEYMTRKFFDCQKGGPATTYQLQVSFWPNKLPDPPSVFKLDIISLAWPILVDDVIEKLRLEMLLEDKQCCCLR